MAQTIGGVEPATTQTVRGTLRPSYSYQWDSADKPTIYQLGVLARRDPAGQPIFNFVQISAEAEPAMDWESDYTPATAALALTIIVLLLERAGVSQPRHRVRAIARDFAELFLCSMPPDGGCIPIEVMDHWLHHALGRTR